MPLTHVAQPEPAADVLHSKEKIHANKGFHADNCRLGHGMWYSLVNLHRRFRETAASITEVGQGEV
jgi:hypothetical protein